MASNAMAPTAPSSAPGNLQPSRNPSLTSEASLPATLYAQHPVGSLASISSSPSSQQQQQQQQQRPSQVSLGPVSPTMSLSSSDSSGLGYPDRKLSQMSSESSTSMASLLPTLSAAKRGQLISKVDVHGAAESSSSRSRSELQVRMNVGKLTAEDVAHLIEKLDAEIHATALEYEKLYDPPLELQQKLEELQRKAKDLRACRAEKLIENELAVLRYTPLDRDYLFAHPDSQFSLQFEDGESGKKEPGVKAGTLPKLIERLTFDEFTDPNFAREFFLTYRSFITPDQFLDLLIQRLDIPQPKEPALLEHFTERIAIPVRLRVLQVIKKWVDEHYDDFELDPALRARTTQLLSSIVEKNTELSTNNEAMALEGPLLLIAKGILNLFSYRETHPYTRYDDGRYSSALAPDPILPLNGSTESEILRWDAEEIARQMTIIDFRLFRNITQSDLSSLGCGKPTEACETITAFINRFNLLSNWVAGVLVSKKGLHSRKEALIKFIDIAECCRHLNNFNGLTAIVAALQNSSIYRLKNTWGMLPATHKKVFDVLCQLTSNAGNYKIYRRMLAAVKPPCIPYIGIYLTDLTFIRDGNPNEILVGDDQRSLINFSKRRMLSSVLVEMLQYQETPYLLNTVDQLKKQLLALESLSEERCYQESLTIEPRGAAAHFNRRVAFIVNPKARNGRAKKVWLKKIKPRVEELFPGRWAEFLTTASGEASVMAKEAMQAGFNVIVTVGGDGTFNEVVDAYMKYGGLARHVVLGILPMGSGDDLVKSLNLSLDPLEALDVINGGYTIEIDCGLVHSTPEDGKEFSSSRYFTNICSLGVNSMVAAGGDKAKAKPGFFQASFKQKNKPVRVRIDQSSWIPCNLFELAICNGSWYGGGYEIAPSANLTDGLFDIVLLEDIGLMESARLSHLIRSGQHINNKNRHLFFGSEVVVESMSTRDADRLTIESDGQAVGTLPAKFQLLKEAVALIVPEVHNRGRMDGVIARRSANDGAPLLYRKRAPGSSLSSSDLTTPGSLIDFYNQQAYSEYDPTKTARQTFDGKSEGSGSWSKSASKSITNPASATALDGETAQRQKLRESLEGKKKLQRSSSDGGDTRHAVEKARQLKSTGSSGVSNDSASKTSTSSLDDAQLGATAVKPAPSHSADLNDLHKRFSTVRKKQKCFGVDLQELLIREKLLVPRFIETCGAYISVLLKQAPLEEVTSAVMTDMNDSAAFDKLVQNFKYQYERSKDAKFIELEDISLETILGAMVLFFARMPTALATQLQLDIVETGQVINAADIAADQWRESKAREHFVECLARVPKLNFMTLAYTCCVLQSVVQLVPASLKKLGDTFAPAVFGIVTMPSTGSSTEDQTEVASNVMQILVKFSADLFANWQSR
ncbi:hypothetical protein CAOG_05959 [Capsaspora owczarzaki ATCC 30864]|uniref:Uncharacterized protein n=1 Tax=Capsaspora owczarzaki (strain ATCC 30864) TaxID=595528 RepID=A0A0D2WT38_CAPO3|nr:hypothetical protein CAOG_05959 [Capsaspora owczarzaki ATCC 30864]KJE95510.1 hypothetical protein CAOG_005959 [Capsaspora owczarzaki ATCC 30864]|eukprot:XP_004345549.2 hypothetical protein CAOG_05959 [Capsaspora owczarzaki ATCC 30864]